MWYLLSAYEDQNGKTKERKIIEMNRFIKPPDIVTTVCGCNYISQEPTAK